jgi:alcohol dehydrogenase
VLDLNEQRLDFCKTTMGVNHTVVVRNDGSELERLKELTDGALPTVVIDATGNYRSMGNALNYVAHTGKLVYVGITTDEVRFGHPLMHRREMTLLASRNALSADFDRIIEHIEEGRIDTRPWITHRTSFDDLIGNFPSYTRPETGVIKAVVEVD